MGPRPPVVLASQRAIQSCPSPPGEKEIGRPERGRGSVGVREGNRSGGKASLLSTSNPGKRLKVAVSLCLAALT
eukprot:4261898-Pyramimonas_sp.AAC.1